MDWIQFAIFMSGMAGMFTWLRSDIQIQRTESAADRRDILNLIRQIQDEMKDFHTKLALQDQDFKFHMLQHHKEK